MKKILRRLIPHAGTKHVALPASDKEDKTSSSSTLSTLAKTSDRYGLRLIPPHPSASDKSDDNFELDIVAVHGLGGDFYRTWTKKANELVEADVFWLSQLLPVDLPGSRVFSFGYDSRPAFSKCIASIEVYAEQLLQYLLAKSSEGKRRSTIFICHSLGGLVVKQAMVTANNEPERFGEITRTTKAIMFMGTPHRGSDIASMIEPIAQAVNFGLKYSGGSIKVGNLRYDLIRMLSRNSEALDRLNESFIPRTKDMCIISCVEMRSPPNWNEPVVSKQSAVLGILGEIRIPIYADHMSMCQFSSLTDPNYEIVRDALLTAARPTARRPANIETASTNSLQSLTDSEKKFISYFKKDFQPAPTSQRVKGTCAWLLDTIQYMEWQADKNPALLWITGEAGCGKTTLTSFVLEELKKETIEMGKTHSRPIVLSFFCARDNDARNDGQSIICGLLTSLFTARRDIIHQVQRKYGPIKQEIGPNLKFLWDVLMFALNIASSDPCYIIIDALDECDDSSRERLLACIAEMLNSYQAAVPPRHGRIKLMCTSQPLTVTEWNALETSNLRRVKIEDRPYGLTQDILTVINHEMDNLVHRQWCSRSFATNLREALCQKSQNSFLWVSLVLPNIKTTLVLEANEPQQLLDYLPGSLEEAFIKYLPLSTSQNAKMISTCVQILVASRRSLTVGEVRAFVNVAVQGYKLTGADQLVIFQNSLQRMFGPLILLTGPRVEFIHSTVKDFFIRLGQIANDEQSKSYGTDITSAHLALADACTGYLLGQDLESDFFNDVEPPAFVPPDDFEPTDVFNIQDFALLANEEARINEVCSNLRHRFPAFDYAAMHWTRHFAYCEHIASDDLKQRVQLLSKPNNIQVSNWYNYMECHSKTTVPKFACLNEVLIAAMFGFTERLQDLLTCEDRQSNISEAQCKVAIFWAASQGHSRVVQIFLEHGTNPNFLEHGQAPLTVAVRGGHEDVVSKLLQSPLIDPNFCDGHSRSPLLHAVAGHQHEIIGLLRSYKNVAVNLADKSGYTPLLEAASAGCSSCLLTLKLDKDVDLNKCDIQGRNCLSLAASTDSKEAIKLIVENLCPLEVRSTDKSGRNALSYAAERSDRKIVKRLWKLKIPISQADHDGRNVISWAVGRPSITNNNHRCKENDVLKFLIEKSPTSADIKDNAGWTPLAWAVDGSGDIGSIKVLVEAGGIDVNQQDQSGWSALSWAVTQCSEEIVRYLLSVPGVQKNLQSLAGSTPLALAASNGRLAIVRLLLATPEVDPYIKDYQGRSPIDLARLNQHDDIARELSFLDLA